MNNSISFLDALVKYATPYKASAPRLLTEDEKKRIISIIIDQGSFGLSAKLTMRDGISYVPLSRDSQLALGDVVPLDKALIITLTRGNEVKYRFDALKK